MSLCAGILSFSTQLNYRIFLADLPYKHAQHIHQINLQQSELEVSGIGMASRQAVDLLAYKSANQFGTLVSQQPGLAHLTLSEDIQVPFALLRVSANFEEVFPIELSLNGALNLSAQTIFISHKMWSTLFSERSDILGALVKVNNEPFIIAGVIDPSFTLPNTLAIQNIMAGERQEMFALTTRSAFSSANDIIDASNISIETVDVFFQTSMSKAQTLPIIESLVVLVNQSMPRSHPLSFELLSLREGISGSWYLFAPIMLAGSIFIFFIGFVAVCNLVLVKSNKDLKHTTIELILGASSRFVLAKECVEYGLVCLLSVFLGLQLSQFFSAYLSTLFNQWDEHQMHPSWAASLVVGMLMLVLIVSLIIVSKRAIDARNLSKTSSASGKNASSKINVNLLKRLTAYQVFAMSSLLIIGSSSFVSATYQMLPLLKAQFEQTTVIPIEFKHMTTSKSEQARVINEISDKLSQSFNNAVIGHSNADPFFLTSSYGACSQQSREIRYGRMYSDEAFLNTVNAKVTDGSLGKLKDTNAIVINSMFAEQYFGTNENLIGKSVNCKKISGVVVAVVELNRIVHPLLKDIMSQDDAVIIQAFDWVKNKTMLSDVPHLTLYHPQTEFLPNSDITSIFAQYASLIEPAKPVNLSEQIDQQGRQPRLALFFSGVLTFTFLLLAVMGLWGSMNLQIQMRRSELAIFKMMGITKWKLLLFVFNDNKKQVIKLVSVSAILSLWIAFLLGMGSTYRLEILLSVLAIICILLVASIMPMLPMLKSKNINGETLK
jgi:ABC-type antimicrobial peptide transport system permease subunit